MPLLNLTEYEILNIDEQEYDIFIDLKPINNNEQCKH